MRPFLLLALLAAWVVPGVLLPAADPKAAEALQGAWVVVSAQRDGRPADDVKGHRLILKGDRFTISLKDRVLYRGTFKVDPSAKPAAIDFLHAEGEARGKTWLGIYQLAGADLLGICDNAPDPTRGRPTEFDARPGSGHVLVRLKRE